MNRGFSRRTLLKSSGVALALPVLESMTPALAQTVDSDPQRLLVIGATLGFYPAAWFPTVAGREYETTEHLKHLERHRSRFTVFSRLSHEEQSGRQPHNSEITWLTAARRPGLDGFQNTVSMDQVAAKHVGYATRLPSVSLGSLTQQSQSYTTSGVMVPAESSPATLFRKLFLQGKPEEIQREEQSLNDGGSILDSLQTQTDSLRRTASANDRQKLDSYMDALRSAERDLAKAGAWLHRPKPVVDAAPPSDISNRADIVGRTKLMFELIPLILETDSSRVISMMIQDHGAVPPIEGVTQDQHNLSHHGQDSAKIEQLKIVETLILQRFADLLDSLHTVSETTGTLLDNTTVMFGSNLGNANSHHTENVPVLVAGGRYRHGQHVTHHREHDMPLCNLYVTLLQGIGMEIDSFGQSDGALTWT